MTNLNYRESYVIALGNFDGVHIGHQALIQRAVALASELRVRSKVVSFNPHPLELIKPPHTRIMSLSIQFQKFKLLGCHEVQYLKFEESLRNTEAREFLNHSLGSVGLIQAIVVGFNFRFGRGRLGDCRVLEDWGKSRDIKVEVLSPIQLGNQVISTSQIRKFLQLGQMESVSQMLGEPLEFEGLVVPGDQRGRQIGFPTLNLGEVKTQLPGPGVYVCQVKWKGDFFRGVAHIGSVPTFGITESRVEIHILDFDQDLYGERVSCSVLSRIREVRAYGGRPELVSQIKNDLEVCRLWGLGK